MYLDQFSLLKKNLLEKKWNFHIFVLFHIPFPKLLFIRIWNECFWKVFWIELSTVSRFFKCFLRDKSIASMKDMFELEEKRLQYRMRTSSPCRHLRENLFGRLVLSSSRNFQSGRKFSKEGFLTDDDCTTLNATFCKTQFRLCVQVCPFKPIQILESSKTPNKNLSQIRERFGNIHILHFLAS